MQTTGSQIVKAAVPMVALTGSGFFGSLVAGVVIAVGLVGSALVAGTIVYDVIDTRRKRLRAPAAQS